MNISLDISPALSVSPSFSALQAIPQSKKRVVTGAHIEIYLTHFVALFPDDKEGVSVVFFKHSFSGIIFVPLDDNAVFSKLGQSKDIRCSPAQSKDFQNSGR